MEDDGSSESVGYIYICRPIQKVRKKSELSWFSTTMCHGQPQSAVLGSDESCQPQSTKTTNLNWRAQQVNVVNVRVRLNERIADFSGNPNVSIISLSSSIIFTKKSKHFGWWDLVNQRSANSPSPNPAALRSSTKLFQAGAKALWIWAWALWLSSSFIHVQKDDINTSSTAQGGGGSFKNRKPIGKVGCCESRMAQRSHWWIERWLMSPLFLSLWLSTYLPTYLSTYVSIDLFIYLSFYLSIYLSIYLSMYLSIYLTIYLSI